RRFKCGIHSCCAAAIAHHQHRRQRTDPHFASPQRLHQRPLLSPHNHRREQTTQSMDANLDQQFRRQRQAHAFHKHHQSSRPPQILHPPTSIAVLWPRKLHSSFPT